MEFILTQTSRYCKEYSCSKELIEDLEEKYKIVKDDKRKAYFITINNINSFIELLTEYGYEVIIHSFTVPYFWDKEDQDKEFVELEIYDDYRE